MTKKIVKRTDANNETLYFYTHSDAVDVGEGNATISLTNALNSKASASDLQALSNTVNTKASASDLQALSNVVATKASTSDLNSLNNVVLKKTEQALTQAEKDQVHNNLDSDDFLDERAVRYDEYQVLGPEERELALVNLGLNGVDAEPTKNSQKMVRSGGVAEAIDNVQYARFDGIQETSVTLNTTTTATGNGSVLFYVPNNVFIYKVGSTYYTLWNNTNRLTNGFYNDDATTPHALTTKIFINTEDGLPYSFDGTDFTTVAIDDAPTAGSENLVKSGGVTGMLSTLTFKGYGDTKRTQCNIKGIIKGHTYRLYIKSLWSHAQISESRSYFEFGYTGVNGNYVPVYVNNDITNDYFDITVGDNIFFSGIKLYVWVRADDNEEVVMFLQDVTLVKELYSYNDIIRIKGAGSTLKQVDNIPVLSGHTYKVWLKDKNISIEGVTGYSILNIVLKRKGNSTIITRYAEVLLAGTLADYYIADIPTEYNDYTLTISIRSAVGTEQLFFIEDITGTQELQEQITEVSQGLDGVVEDIYGNEGDYTEGAYLNGNLADLVKGNISSGITPLIPAQVGDKVITHCGYYSGEARYMWLYGSNEEPLSGMYYTVSPYSANPLTITKEGTTYIRASFNMNADDVYISVNGVKVWEYQKKATGLAEWNYKAVGINKVIYGEGQYDCWKSGYVNKSGGTEHTSTVNSCTGFIEIEDFDTIETTMSVIPSDSGNTDAAVCFYNESGTFVSSVEPNYYGSEQSYEARVIDVPHDAKYVRLSVYNQFRQHWKLIGIRKSSISGGGSNSPKPQKVTLEFGNLDSNGQMKPYSSDFFDNARTSLYYSLQSVNLPYSYTIFVFNKTYTLIDTISAQADTDYALDPTKWHKIVINYTANSLPVKELVINLNVIDTSYNVIPAKTIKTFQYLVKYKKGRGLYSDGDVDYSEVYNMADNLISNTLRFYLPSNYSPTGEPVKLMYKAHGTSGYASINQTTWGGDASIDYLADEGFAIYDMFAGTSYYSGQTTNRIANYNLPIQLAAQKAAYEWVVRNFNVDPRIYVVGKSHGGLAGIYVTNNIVPTRAVALLAPLITQIADRYQPWGLQYAADTSMCLDDMCFTPPDGMTFDEMVNVVHTPSSGWKNILLSNLDKQVGLNPYINGVTNVSQEALLTALMDNEYKTLGGMNNIIRHSDVPVKVWCAFDDEQVLYTNGYNWIKSLQNGGSNAQFRAYPTGHGRHNFDSFTSTDETIIKDDVVTALGVSYHAPRVYIEVVNFLNQF